jgi:hypothetical protein
LVIASFWFLSAETVVKNSSPFNFPVVTGIKSNLFLYEDFTFSYRPVLTGKKAVEIAWSVPVTEKNGTLSIFNVSGALVRRFAVTSRSGIVRWECDDQTVANGVYFVKLSYGTVFRNLKMVLYR